MFWLAPSIRYLDFDWETFLKEMVLIGNTGNTIFTYDILADMDFKDYEFLIRVINEVYKPTNEG